MVRDGRLRGPTNDPSRPRHLQGLVRCVARGSTFKVAGAGGEHLTCGGYACGVRTRPRRDRGPRSGAGTGDATRPGPSGLDFVCGCSTA
ncbi:MAG TPA: hypothetical protein VMZ71_00290 [Gemmataceae bacterium]|nr:hypothetical protein [Gemmataceae bacterium]